MPVPAKPSPSPAGLSRRRWGGRLAVLAAFLPTRLPGADLDLSLEDLVEAGRRWAAENLDESLLAGLPAADRARITRFLAELQKDLAGDYVLDLATAREQAEAALPWLQAYAPTRPYAVWLRTRLDYFEVADRLTVAIRPPARPPGQPAPRPANPTPEAGRAAWQRQMEPRPSPPGSAGFVPRLSPIFVSEGAPRELVWLAEVESSFDPSARSPAGALGLYQLMPATARAAGLRLEPRDERLDPEKNARAAARLLRRLGREFRDWRLALAAYNAGDGRVRRELQRQSTRSFDAIAQRLPAETQMYVPKVEGTLRRRTGSLLTRLPLPP